MFFNCILDFSRWYTIAGTPFLSKQSNCKVWSCYVQLFRRRCIYKKSTLFQGQTWNVAQSVSSTSYDLCIRKVWSCYARRLRRKCIYKKYLIWPWPKVKVTWSITLLHHATYVPAKFEVATANGLGDTVAKNTLFDLKVKGQGHTISCPVPSTSCDLCIGKVWYCYIPRLWRRCIYKKIHYLTLTLRSQEMLTSALYISHQVTYAKFEVTTSKV